MLQQTRVDTVLRYYDRWLDRFPTLEALAGADQEEVLKQWEGLGYYRRARNLHRAARVVREEMGGRWPREVSGLRDLPGVGEYTAGALASIAFGKAVPAVDGNVKRVLARLHDEERPTAAWLRDTAGRWVDRGRPGDWNQALMEHGATVCTPRSPACPRCPVQRWCEARRKGTVDRRPAPVVKRRPKRVRIALAVLHRNGRVLLEKRPDDGLLGGMWALPERRLDQGSASDPPEKGSRLTQRGGDVVRGAVQEISRRLALSTDGSVEVMEPVRHRFTHLDATYLPGSVAVDAAATQGSWHGDRLRWVEGQAVDVAIPVAQRKVLDAWLSEMGHENE
jgi:A/G-specific adenine glycosylase